MIADPATGEYAGYSGLAVLAKNGYASFLHGNVVDMLYFPVIHGHFPTNAGPAWESQLGGNLRSCISHAWIDLSDAPRSAQYN